jgi:hypothetical protein
MYAAAKALRHAISELAQNVVPVPNYFGAKYLNGFSVIILQQTAEQRLACYLAPAFRPSRRSPVKAVQEAKIRRPTMMEAGTR